MFGFTQILFFMKNLYTLLLILISFTAFSQTLRGKVTDSNGNPLAGATIQFNSQGTIADQDGSFTIGCSGAGRVTVRFVGYEILSRSISDCATEITLQLIASTQLLNEVEITATSNEDKLILSQPATIAKLGITEIQRGNGLFLDDAINANVPGVFMQRRTNSAGQQFNIRGYGGGGPGNRGTNNNFDQLGIKAYLNGIPITDAEGITLMDDIDFNSIGNVEVLKGPSGSLYGLAIAGVVNLQTRRPEKNQTSIGQNVMVGSYGLRRYTTQLQVSNENTSLLINYGKQSFDGFMPHTRAFKDFVNVMGDFKLNKKQTLTTYFGYSNSYDERNGELTAGQYDTLNFTGNPAYIKNDAHTNVVSFRAGIGHTIRVNENFSNTTSVFGTGLNSNVSSAGGWTDKEPFNVGFRSVFNTKFHLGGDFRLSGVTGVEAQMQFAHLAAYNMVANAKDPTGNNIIGTLRTNQSQNTSTYSIFSQWTLALPMDFSLTAGVSTSYMNIRIIDKLFVAANNTASNTTPTTYFTSYDNLWSPSVALNKVLNKNMSAHISYNVGYRAPVASNIYTPLANAVNTALRPERGTQLEIGTKGNLMEGRLTYELAWFSSNFQDKMTFVGVPNAANNATLYSLTINGGEWNNVGIEAMVKYSILQSDVDFVKLLRPFVNYTYSDFKYGSFTFQNNINVPPADYNNNQVAGVPRVVYNAGVDFVSNSGLYANATYMYRDDMPYTPDGLNIAKGFALLNAKIGFRKTFASHFDADLYFGAQNITSQKHYQMLFVNQLPDSYLPGPKDINYFGGLNFRYIF